MEHTKDALHALIHALSPVEQRYVELHASQLKEAARYMELFEAMVKMPVYDEQALMQNLSGASFLRQLSIAKNYLRRLILDAMAQFHADDSPDERIGRVLREVKFLCDKDLYDQASELLNRAAEIARKYERTVKMLDIHAWQRTIAELNPAPAEQQEQARYLLSEQLATLKTLKNAVEYQLLYEQVFRLIRNEGNSEDPLEELENLISTPALKDENGPLSFDARCYFLSIHAHAHFMLGNKKESLEYAATLKDLFERKPQQIEIKERTYLDALYNYVHICYDNGNIQDLAAVLVQLRQRTLRSQNLQAQLMALVFSFSILLAIEQGEDTSAIVHEALRWYNEQHMYLDYTAILLLLQRMLQGCYAAGEWQEAQQLHIILLDICAQKPGFVQIEKAIMLLNCFLSWYKHDAEQLSNSFKKAYRAVAHIHKDKRDSLEEWIHHSLRIVGREKTEFEKRRALKSANAALPAVLNDIYPQFLPLYTLISQNIKAVQENKMPVQIMKKKAVPVPIA